MERRVDDRDPRLRERRLQRAMTQQEVAEALERLAWVQCSRHVGVNADMVSKWERGEKAPSRFYLRLLCSLFDATPDQLGFRAQPRVDPGSAASVPAASVATDLSQTYDALARSGARVDALQPKMLELWREELLSRRQLLRAMGVAPAMVGLDAIESALGMLSPPEPAFQGQETIAKLGELAHQLETLYHSCLPRQFLLPVRALAGTVEDLIPDVRERDQRRAMLSLLARAQLLAGRLCFFDLHEALHARAHWDLAREAAAETASPLLSAVVFGHIAFLPADKRNLPASASYMSAARASLSRQPVSLVSSWLSAVESEFSARAGMSGSAMRSLGRAGEEFPDSAARPVPVWFDYFDERRLRGFEGYALRKAGKLPDARRKLQEALSPGPGITPKQRVVSMLDLAVTCVESGDLDEGCRLATKAAVDLHHAGYATAVDRLVEFHATLPDQRHPAARLLRESIAELS